MSSTIGVLSSPRMPWNSAMAAMMMPSLSSWHLKCLPQLPHRMS